ncbi:GNAT family N-acetyltransferase [Paenibacillus sp. XY044]|uniref:GNAT family N-acetyltransferase n=1 Tax=Paenibacillus sp. XY044 TaxID=2026089 RepID=UPI000B98231D|nr:GNAT family N-acetyltransferase [Paenibacillus sp. XY044]OZB94994.1 GNAT family N-acetyltransferase [Paenibacillus sp. XY044]
MVVTWSDQYTGAVIGLWNTVAVRDGYKEMTEASFSGIFTDNRYFDPENTFVLLEEGEVKGFACGCTGGDLPLGDHAGYITCIVLADEVRTDDNYKVMLEHLEGRFQALGKSQADVLFFNPMMLPWYIPDTPRHEHNNAPGVPTGSRLHSFLQGQGYVERAQECAMYLDLSSFSIPQEIRGKEEKAQTDGYTVELFEQGKHHGVSDMLQGFDNPLWQKEIAQSTADGVPVVVAAHHGKVVGFAGPVIRQASGRGYFAGIGVHPEHEGHGLGSILFFKLCEAFQKIGTAYMSLYTGSTNPAIRIYEKAGFKTVRTFSIMRREF